MKKSHVTATLSTLRHLAITGLMCFTVVVLAGSCACRSQQKVSASSDTDGASGPGGGGGTIGGGAGLGFGSQSLCIGNWGPAEQLGVFPTSIPEATGMITMLNSSGTNSAINRRHYISAFDFLNCTLPEHSSYFRCNNPANPSIAQTNGYGELIDFLNIEVQGVVVSDVEAISISPSCPVSLDSQCLFISDTRHNRRSPFNVSQSVPASIVFVPYSHPMPQMLEVGSEKITDECRIFLNFPGGENRVLSSMRVHPASGDILFVERSIHDKAQTSLDPTRVYLLPKLVWVNCPASVTLTPVGKLPVEHILLLHLKHTRTSEEFNEVVSFIPEPIKTEVIRVFGLDREDFSDELDQGLESGGATVGEAWEASDFERASILGGLVVSDIDFTPSGDSFIALTLGGMAIEFGFNPLVDDIPTLMQFMTEEWHKVIEFGLDDLSIDLQTEAISVIPPSLGSEAEGYSFAFGSKKRRDENFTFDYDEGGPLYRLHCN